MIVVNYALVMAIAYFAIPFAWPSVHITLIQAATITLISFVAKTFLSPEAPEIYLINGKDNEGDE
jgi:hypothetical protein